MNTDDRFDDELRDRLRADAPREAPSGLLDATMSRIAGTQQRSGRWFGAPASRLLAVAAVAVHAAAVAGEDEADGVGEGGIAEALGATVGLGSGLSLGTTRTLGEGPIPACRPIRPASCVPASTATTATAATARSLLAGPPNHLPLRCWVPAMRLMVASSSPLGASRGASARRRSVSRSSKRSSVFMRCVLLIAGPAQARHAAHGARD